MQLALLSLLLVILTLLIWRAVTRERREYAQFKRLRATEARQKVYRKWLIESVLIMGGLSGAVLLAVWPIVPEVLADTQAWAPIAWLRDFFATGFGVGIAIGAAIGGVLGLIAPVLVLRDPDAEVPMLGDIGALLPRTRAELRYGAGLAFSAGIFEETLFRFGLPALVFGILGGNGPVAFAICAVLFGLLHLYQKAIGVLTATILGLVLTLIYVVSGSIVLVIVIHALIDLRSLVLLPWLLMRRAEKKKADAVAAAAAAVAGGETAAIPLVE